MSQVIVTDQRPVTPEPSALRLVMTLAIAGLISGIAIVAVFEATFDTIETNRALELEQAVFNVLPGITAMQPVSLTAPSGETRQVYAGFDQAGDLQGFAIPASGAGFQDTIRLIYGYHPHHNQIVGMQVLDSRETPGLGDKIIKDDNFVNQFDALEVTPAIELVKGKGTRANQVDGITGATISSRAVVNIINSANQAWLASLPAEVQKDE